MIRPIRQVVLATFIIVLIIVIAGHRHGALRHVLDPALFNDDFDAIAEVTGSDEDTSRLCRSHGFRNIEQHVDSPRRVYDLFLLATELEWLEIRLHTLAPVVDYFVIVEAPRTFTNLLKPLYLMENWDRFAAFHHKMLQYVLLRVQCSFEACANCHCHT